MLLQDKLEMLFSLEDTESQPNVLKDVIHSDLVNMLSKLSLIIHMSGLVSLKSLGSLVLVLLCVQYYFFGSF